MRRRLLTIRSKRGHTNRTSNWLYSRFHRYVAEGRLPQDWGVGVDGDAGCGERG